MIPAPPGLVARYWHDESESWSELPIAAFTDDGDPLILDQDSEANGRHLVRADVYSNFDSIGDDPHPGIASLLPSGGWRVEYTSKDGNSRSEPLVGWGLKADGRVVPLTTDRTGDVEDLVQYSGEYRIYHPDATSSEQDEENQNPNQGTEPGPETGS